VYIQAATKIFGHWAVEHANRWDNDALHEIKAVVDTVMTRVKEFTSSPHIEVQERVLNILTLCSL